jgi:hypothetical protein
MTLSANSRIRAAEGVLVRELDGEAVLLNVNTEQYYGLDEVGARLWAVLTQAESLQAALDQLLGEYEVEADVLRRDVEALAADLLAQGLIRVL